MADTSRELTVDRGAYAARINALAVIFSAALGVGVSLGIELGARWGVPCGLEAAVLTAMFFRLAYRVARVRRGLMAVMHWITGE
jgi:hypothetical protein